MKVRYTTRARGDLLTIFAYLDERSPAGARAVKSRIERRISGLADFPFMAPLTEEPGVYELTLVRYPYKIYYQVEDDEVRILHIRHAARRTWGSES